MKEGGAERRGGRAEHRGKAAKQAANGISLPAQGNGFQAIQISPSRYRVADIAVWRAGNIGDRIPTVPPFLAVEILSPEDRITRMQPKIQDYLSIGVECI
jgi:hypothetical protein